MARPVVALVLVSHSRALAEGAAELAGQMAPDVALLPAGGTDDGSLGTGFDRVLAALGSAVADGRGAVVLTDLGSAVMTAESVLDVLDAEDADRVRIADAPFVEGAVAAAVAAQGGAGLDAVLRAARHAGASFEREPGDPQASDGECVPGSTSAGASTATAAATARTVLRNRQGLHARPAAALARAAGAFQSSITVNGADARSVLSLVALGAVGGTEVVVSATGPDARGAVVAIIDELESGFGEA